MDQTPAQVASSSHAFDVLKVLEDKSSFVYPANTVESLDVMNLGKSLLGGKYLRTSPRHIPNGFRKVCEHQSWPTQQMWERLNGSHNPWFKVSIWVH